MKNRPSILLTHTPAMRANYYGERALSGLGDLAAVHLHESEEPLDGTSLARRAAGCAIVIADRNTPIPATALQAMPDVIAVLRVAVDIRNIDVTAASSEGILVCQASRTWVPSVAEHVLGLMIDAARGISRANIAYKQGHLPEVRMGRQLFGATAGIIGYGPLGRRVAELLAGIGMHVLVTDPYVHVGPSPVIEQVGLDELLARSEFVVPLAVATAETEDLIGARELGLMRPDALLVNLSRGNLIDETALEAALDTKQIAGAALDVGRAPDQMPSPRLARRPDVSATPHVGGLTLGAIEGQAIETVAQAREILAGRIPAGAVNAEMATRLARIG